MILCIATVFQSLQSSAAFSCLAACLWVGNDQSTTFLISASKTNQKFFFTSLVPNITNKFAQNRVYAKLKCSVNYFKNEFSLFSRSFVVGSKTVLLVERGYLIPSAHESNDFEQKFAGTDIFISRNCENILRFLKH